MRSLNDCGTMRMNLPSILGAAGCAAGLACGTAVAGEEAPTPVAKTLLRVNNQPLVSTSEPGRLLESGQLFYVGQYANADDALTATWSYTADPDPNDEASFNGYFELTNNTAQPVDVEFRLSLPMCPTIDEASTMGAFVIIAMTTNQGGGLMSLPAGDSVWSLMVDGHRARGLFHGPYALQASGAATMSTHSSFGMPMPSESGPEVNTDFGLRHVFTLTPGERVRITTVTEVGGDPDYFQACIPPNAGRQAFVRIQPSNARTDN